MSPLARLAAFLLLAATLSGCVLNPGGSEGTPGTTGPANGAATGGTGTDATTTAPPTVTGNGTSSAPPNVPDWDACRGAASTPDPVAVVRVVNATGHPQANMTIQAMHEWYPYDDRKTDASGCVAFGFNGPGEYQFATEAGDCERQGTTTREWDGVADINVDLAIDTVCNQA